MCQWHFQILTRFSGPIYSSLPSKLALPCWPLLRTAREQPADSHREHIFEMSHFYY